MPVFSLAGVSSDHQLMSVCIFTGLSGFVHLHLKRPSFAQDATVSWLRLLLAAMKHCDLKQLEEKGFIFLTF